MVRRTSSIRFTPGMLLRMLADALMLQAALLAGVGMRLFLLIAFQDPSKYVDASALVRRDMAGYFSISWPLTLLSLAVFYLNGFYTYGKHYQGRYKALVVSRGILISFVLYGFASYYVSQDHQLPIARGAFILAFCFAVALIVGARIWNNLWKRVVDPEHETLLRRKDDDRPLTLVIGGAGYIGSALIPLLLQRGERVRLLDMLMFGEEPIRSVINHPDLEVIRGDFRHVENVVEAMQGVDSVVHLGAIVGDPACSLDEDLTIDVNLTATRMIAQLAKTARVDRFIFASTCSVYGACDETLDERSQVRPISLYGHTKLASESVLWSLADDTFRPTVVRFSTIYGLSGRTRFDLVVNLLTAKAKIDGEITVFGGDQWRPFVHVEDAARAVALVLDSPGELVDNEIFNVGSNDQNYTIRQVGELVKEQVVGATLIVNDDDVDKRNYRVSFSKIHNYLGFTPKWTVQAGIQQVLESIASGEVADYRDSQYSNVKFLTESGTTQLARDQWAKELIRDLTKS
ncbi:MAG: NAD-dependent epimerase/dehydratase family protein [Planctomycetales bacterium]|nr:NAD-dependent epimerase/dehydratase family protein [Planctomycetales bacterium]